MKRMKKFASLLLALVMAFALAVPAMAAGDEGDGSTTPATTANIIVPTLADHTFVAYQIFSGTQAKDAEGNLVENAPLADIKWGTGIDANNLLIDLKQSDKFGDPNLFREAASAEDVANVLASEKFTDAMAIEFARIATGNTKGDGIADREGTGKITVPTGYYLIVDVTELEGENAVRNASLLQLTRDVEVKVKVDVPQVDKEVKEDSTDSFGEGADYSIGDTVPFQFTSAVPNMTQYETYQYIFHDKMDAGLTFKEDSVEITIGGALVDKSNYTVVTKEANGDPLADKCTFEVRFTDLKSVVAAMEKNAGDPVVVSFTAKLNAQAVIGSTGNKNDVFLEYSNNPSDDGDGETGKTPHDTVVVFTYELDVTKVDGKDGVTTLKGAEFVLMESYDKQTGEDGRYAMIRVSDNHFVGWSDTRIDGEEMKDVIGDDGATVSTLVTTKLESDENGQFQIYGLDAGTYYLRETKAPAGYNTPEKPFEVVIARDPNFVETEDGATYTNLTITVTNLNNEDEEVPGGSNSDAGTVNTTIANNGGIVLPETGGIGTTIFYVLGGLLTVGAVVLLVTKKRMSLEEK